MRIKHKVNVVISEDAAGEDILFGLNDKLAEVTIDGYTRCTSGKFAIPMNTVETLSLGDVTAVKGLYVKFDGDCKVTLNGGTDIFQIRKPTEETTVRLFMEADISEVEVTAETTVDLTGTYVVWGDTT